MVTEVTSSSQFNSYIQSSKITVVDFFAVWYVFLISSQS